MLECHDCPLSLICLALDVDITALRCPHCCRYCVWIWEKSARIPLNFPKMYLLSTVCKNAVVTEVITCGECTKKGRSYKHGPISKWGFLQGEAALETLP